MRNTPSHGVESFQKWTPAEDAFNEQLIKCTENVHKALCGEFPNYLDCTFVIPYPLQYSPTLE